MHLSERSHVLIVAAAVLGHRRPLVARSAVALLWCWPAAVLLAGLAGEGLLMRRLVLSADVAASTRALLGRSQEAAFEFRNASSRRVRIEYAPAMPPGFEPLPCVRALTLPANGTARDPFALSAVRLGPQRWPALPVRCLGAAGLAWWTRELSVQRIIRVAPDSMTLHARPALRPSHGAALAARARRRLGALPAARLCARGPARAASTGRQPRAAARSLHASTTRTSIWTFSLRSTRVARVACAPDALTGSACTPISPHASAHVATPNDDRVGLIVYAERPLGGMRTRARPAGGGALA